ncbi:hypothetical protein [Ectothiorhodospira marina]|jgi:hypothetical protein|uniref:Uncharacterized protein n=1 Tax=Ectothiorhodospira marina TaxID=1396821 RepID=A0A1H7NF60_9GAMM|nr:hypothetical protein [Ectothiorhodospira marina]SEL21961.1 hypothetical protein SAMN05444515_111112 [Ectothiorhodospira marina]
MAEHDARPYMGVVDDHRNNVMNPCQTILAIDAAWTPTSAGRTVPLGDEDAAIWCPRDVVRTEPALGG